VRLTGEFLQHDPPRKGELKRLSEFVARRLRAYKTASGGRAWAR